MYHIRLGLCHIFSFSIPRRSKCHTLECSKTFPSLPEQNRTKHYDLRLRQNQLHQKDVYILGFSKSNWVGSEEFKAFLASIIYHHGYLFWRSHKQKLVSLSSATEEYNATSEGTQDLQ
ncbi:hypothetical protein O181_034782 [Austropuccinia psidii MF-1]|uniref:Uncharacterized protein n=1 Tax=Austropuccinia psidii MF-1 TaxID=1389203 RepID=A0A9Q3D3Y8_9BASI|nr:hypothetical protein [Austropuccinia psidii MF-1]